MKVAIFGLGYVGFTAACCIASTGHDVVGIDVSAAKVARIRAGVAPIVEPGIHRLLTSALSSNRLTVDTCIGDHLDDADVAIVCVGTPSAPDGAHDMSFVAEVSRQIARAVRMRTTPLTVAYRSTFRPGTLDDLIAPLFRHEVGADWMSRARLVYNPEFLREGTSVQDYFAPPKIVIGTHDGAPDPVMDRLHEGIEAPVFTTCYREAEFTKFVDNAWHATKVAFANEIGRMCLNLGISAGQVHRMFVADTKLNVSACYLRPGGAFGGSCLPKDVRALQYIAADSGTHMHLVDALIRSNDAHKHRLFEYAVAGLPKGARVLLAGLAFKAETDDLRESPNVDLARKLLTAGFDLAIYDPAVDPAALTGANLGYAFSHLPDLRDLMVDASVAETGHFDRILAVNATARRLNLRGDIPVLDLSALP
ncbi:nucleotide sugar dehydrogenase [Palleronia abyssalis]|uniref:UDP-glucose 6-dehydrogenase n=1 Tax=Palleronia abyssalis TaxID=1501240 RepID=A0A2R8BTK0_9RHOB|nr:nucleotide sugar dehydrogenase [Palleronia abyssalis]SPJ23494.1 GDP-mannose 6-dehydrogenase [Palleronia abyssalis]